MQGSDLLIRLTAIAIAVFGVWLLQTAWRTRGRANGGRITGGWTAIIASLVAWGATSGADKGVALGAVGVILIALIFLLRSALTSERRVPRPVTDRRDTADELSLRTVLRRVWVGALIGPLSGGAALSICTAAFVALHASGVEHTVNLTLVSFGFPVVWAGFAVFAGFETRLLRKSVGVLLGAVAPLAYLAIATGGV